MRKNIKSLTGVLSALLVSMAIVSCDDDPVGLDDPDFEATLLASNEVPPSNATGTGVARFDDEGTHFEYTLSVTGLTAVNGAHIHGPAPAGTNAPVIINLFNPVGVTGAVNGVIATGTISDANNPNFPVATLRTMFNNGTAYVNVHTSANPAGAIRGQIVAD